MAKYECGCLTIITESYVTPIDDSNPDSIVVTGRDAQVLFNFINSLISIRRIIQFY